MFAFEQLKSIHVEITNLCQASCPMCARNYHGGKDNPLLIKSSWTLDEFKTIFNQDVLDTINHVYFCGNFGDPILNNDLIPMCQYLNDQKSTLTVHIHTNGGARKTDWWQKLAQVLPKNHCVLFGIDGLEDTHHLYRVGTTYNNVIANAKAFIDAGGIAEWVFIKFKHNEHQEQEARNRAVKLGFKTFMLKNSSRFLGEPKYRVLDKAGEVTHYLEPPSDNVIRFISKDMIKDYRNTILPLTVKCHVLDLKEIYIDAHKNIFPCCFIASMPYTEYDSDNITLDIRSEIKNQSDSLISDLGGLDNLDAVTKGIKNVVNSTQWQTVWQPYWDQKKLLICARTCGVKDDMSKPKDQFLKRDQLKNNQFENHL